MKFYHLDRALNFNQCTVITGYSMPNDVPINSLFPYYSKHGLYYLFENIDHTPSLMSEMVLEYARTTLFPQMPSRFQCIFATKSLDESKEWANYWQLKNYNIIEIEANSYFELDCSWFTDSKITGTQLDSFIKNRRLINNESVGRLFEEAVKYWKGLHSSKPRLEVLIPLPCQITNIYRVRN